MSSRRGRFLCYQRSLHRRKSRTRYQSLFTRSVNWSRFSKSNRDRRSMNNKRRSWFSWRDSSCWLARLRGRRNIVELRDGRRGMLRRRMSWFSSKRVSWQIALRRTERSGLHLVNITEGVNRHHSTWRPESLRRSLRNWISIVFLLAMAWAGFTALEAVRNGVCL